MKKLLCNLLQAFGCASARQPEPPKQKELNSYEIGRYGTPEQAAKFVYTDLTQAGARDALRDGNPANIAAMLQARPYEHVKIEMLTGVPHDRYGLRSGEEGKFGLKYDEFKSVLDAMPAGEGAKLTRELLAYTAGSPQLHHTKMLEFCIAAGANVDANDGYALRSAIDNGHSDQVEILYKAGASFDVALFGAQVDTKRSGAEVTRKLALYNNKLRANEPGFEPMQVPEMVVVLKEGEKVVAKLPRRPPPSSPMII